ncbi:MAG: spore maturation protein [Clostridia bacterium]|nr:spore maturation protein [Clostridia bacterium]
MPDSSCILPAIALIALLCGLRARIDVYGAFVRGAKEGLVTLVEMLPYLCAVLTASALLRESGAMAMLERFGEPVLERLNLPPETAGVLLLRPLSGSASLAAVKTMMDALGPESRAVRICCVVSAASETVFFTGSLYMGAAGVKKSRGAVAAALLAYVAGVLAAALIIR